MMSADETPAMLEALAAKARRSDATHVHRGRSIHPVIIAYGFFALGVSINIWNALGGGPVANMILPAVMGVLAEAVMFFLPARAISLPWPGKMLAVVLLLFVSAFALTNSLRMASIISADQAAAGADRQTEGVRTADHALEAARAKRDEACGRGLGKTVACQSRRAEVTKLESNQTQATAKVAAQAKPDSTDFADLVTRRRSSLFAPIPCDDDRTENCTGTPPAPLCWPCITDRPINRFSFLTLRVPRGQAPWRS
jgi:hypothetical protein